MEIETIIKDKDRRVPVSKVLEDKEEVDKKYYLSEKAINGINIVMQIHIFFLSQAEPHVKNYSDMVKILIDQNSELKKQHQWRLREKDMKIEIKNSELKTKEMELKNKDKELELMKEIHTHDLKVKNCEMEVLRLKLQITE